MDRRRAGEILRYLAQRHPEVVTREIPTEGGGRATVLYRWESGE